jgi:hypothetical protein
MLSILQFIKNLKELNIIILIRNREEFMIKGVIKKYKSQGDEDHTQEINPK